MFFCIEGVKGMVDFGSPFDERNKDGFKVGQSSPLKSPFMNPAARFKKITELYSSSEQRMMELRAKQNAIRGLQQAGDATTKKLLDDFQKKVNTGYGTNTQSGLP